MKTNASLLRSARRLFEKNGYDNTSIEEITELADVSKSTFFKHFTNKESLLKGIAEDEIADIFEMIEEEGFASNKPVEKIKRILIRLLEDAIPYLHLTGRVVFTTIINSKESGSPFLKIRKVLEELVNEGQEKGDISSDFSKEYVVTTFLGCYYGVIFKWFEEGCEAGSTSELEGILDMIFKGIAKGN